MPKRSSSALSWRKSEGADLVIATDPDCDRMGVAVRSAAGEMKLLTGNQIGSLIAYYRAKTLFDQGVLNAENAARGVIIKTFVTTDLQKAIAEKFGLRCVETLTGFKYIGAKLEQVRTSPARGQTQRIIATCRKRKRAGCGWSIPPITFSAAKKATATAAPISCATRMRNGAAIMFCEVAAYAKIARPNDRRLARRGLCASFGYYEEKNGALTFEGAEGAAKIQRLLAILRAAPPNEMLGAKVDCGEELRDGNVFATWKATRSRRKKC